VDPLDPIVVSITTVHGGTARNIIPEEVELGGTLRTLSEETREFARGRIAEIAAAVASAHRCVAEVHWERDGYPVTRNDAGAVGRFFAVARAAAGASRVSEWPAPVMGGEDFAFYCQKLPSCFFLLGQQRSPDEPYPYVHTPNFNFNDDSLALGVEAFCRLALELTD